MALSPNHGHGNSQVGHEPRVRMGPGRRRHGCVPGGIVELLGGQPPFEKARVDSREAWPWMNLIAAARCDLPRKEVVETDLIERRPDDVGRDMACPRTPSRCARAPHDGRIPSDPTLDNDVRRLRRRGTTAPARRDGVDTSVNVNAGMATRCSRPRSNSRSIGVAGPRRAAALQQRVKGSTTPSGSKPSRTPSRITELGRVQLAI